MEPFTYIDFVQRLRSKADRQAVTDVFQRVWGRALRPQLRPTVTVTPDVVRIGRACLPRVSSSKAAAAGAAEGAHPAAASLRLLDSQLQRLESTMQVEPDAFQLPAPEAFTVMPGSGSHSPQRCPYVESSMHSQKYRVVE